MLWAQDQIADRGHDALWTITELANDALAASSTAILILDGGRLKVAAKAGVLPEGRTEAFARRVLRSASGLRILDCDDDAALNAIPVPAGSRHGGSCVGAPLRGAPETVTGAICAFFPDAGACDDHALSALLGFARLIEQALTAFEDAARLRCANAQLAESNRLFQEAETAAGVGAWSLSLDTGAVRWSPQVFAIHGVDPDTNIDLATAISFYDPSDRQEVENALATARATGRPFKFEATLWRRDGTWRRVRVQGECVEEEDRLETISGIILDCSEEYGTSSALEHAVGHDQLTGLLNRAGFCRILDQSSSAPSGQLLTVLLLDLDGFQRINDMVGHLIADQLIRQIGLRLAACLAEGEFIARWGEDEFVVLLKPDISRDEARLCAARLLHALDDEIVIGKDVFSVSATCGVGQARLPCVPYDVVRRAGVALCFGKQTRPGAVHCWSSELEVTAGARSRAVHRLTHALGAGQAFAAYQAIVSLEDRSIVGFETLLRVDEDPEANLSLSEVFPALSDPLMSRRVFRFMLENLARDAPRLLEIYGSECQFAINVSEADLRLSQGNENFVSVLTSVLRQRGIRPGNIVIEVTESMLLTDEDGHIRDTLRTLNGLGYGIALDDFGTGYSSLTHLRDFPISKVKIDKSFVTAIASNHQSRMIVQAIVQMARSLGITVIAEGVEGASEEMFLRAIGCQQAQGFRFGKAKGLALLDGAGRPELCRASVARKPGFASPA